MKSASSLIPALLKHRSFQVFLVLSTYLIFAQALPQVMHQFFYTLSLFIKDMLIWVMPITVGFFIAYAVQSFEKKAPLFILILLLFEACSNFMSVWYAYGCATFASEILPSFGVSNLSSEFTALWRFPVVKPSWWSAEKGAILGLVLGCFNALKPTAKLTQLITQGRGILEWILTRVFARLIPLFILGFAAQMYQTNLLTHVFAHYSVLVLWLMAFLFIYLLFLPINPYNNIY